MDDKLRCGLNPTEYIVLLDLLRKVQQPWTREFYDMLASMICFSAVELVIFRTFRERTQILLTERQPDEFYAGQFHSPGSMIRSTDAKVLNDWDASLPTSVKYAETIRRALLELGFTKSAVEKDWSAFFSLQPTAIPGFPYRTPRGTENCVLLIGELGHNPFNGIYEDVEHVLEDPTRYKIIPHNLLVIKRAVWAYKSFVPELRKITNW